MEGGVILALKNVGNRPSLLYLKYARDNFRNRKNITLKKFYSHLAMGTFLPEDPVFLTKK